MNIYWKYFKYVVRHKYYVFLACCKRGIIWRGIKHDLSKFLPSEFIPYARHFHGNYPSRDSEDIKRAKRVLGWYPDHLTKEGAREVWERAFLKHLHRNDHHWQHFLFTGSKGNTKPLLMITGAWKEMLADWDGSGKSITGKHDTLEWYRSNRDKMILHPLVRQLTDEHVGFPPLER